MDYSTLLTKPPLALPDRLPQWVGPSGHTAPQTDHSEGYCGETLKIDYGSWLHNQNKHQKIPGPAYRSALLVA